MSSASTTTAAAASATTAQPSTAAATRPRFHEVKLNQTFSYLSTHVFGDWPETRRRIMHNGAHNGRLRLRIISAFVAGISIFGFSHHWRCMCYSENCIWYLS
jgi:hypothetical protein